jgi:hypothetical protein
MVTTPEFHSKLPGLKTMDNVTSDNKQMILDGPVEEIVDEIASLRAQARRARRRVLERRQRPSKKPSRNPFLM